MPRGTRWVDPLRSPDVARRIQDMDFPAPGAPMVSQEGVPMPAATPSAGRAPFVRAVQAPWVQKLPRSIRFLVQDFNVALAAAVGATATSTALRFQVPKDQIGWLDVASLYCRGSDAATDFTVQVRINEAPVPGLDNWRNPPGIADIVLENQNALAIRIPNGAVVDILFTNNSANAETVGGRLAGWYHPAAEEITYWGDVA